MNLTSDELSIKTPKFSFLSTQNKNIRLYYIYIYIKDNDTDTNNFVMTRFARVSYGGLSIYIW